MKKIYLCIKKKKDIKIDKNLNYPHFVKKEESKMAYTLLKNMMNKVGIIFDFNKLRISSNYKPYYEDIYFSYSHSKNYIAIVIAPFNIGIDIEEYREISKTVNEMYLNNSDTPLEDWVKKESYFKLLDSSQEDDFKNIDINKINTNNYFIDNEEYKCSINYVGNKTEIVMLEGW